MTAILADIGGTHARFARLDGPDLSETTILPMAEYPALGDALRRYAGQDGGSVYIATAAWPHADGIWRFARDGRWEIAPSALDRVGWRVGWIGNDFAASALGATALKPEHLRSIHESGPAPHGRAAVLGSGTGLGLAYIEGNRIQETYGGHMDLPRRTEEQETVARLAGRIKGNPRPVTAEDIISGPGLTLLHKAVSLIHGHPANDVPPADILNSRAAFTASETLRLYHEFLGLFAHQAVLYGHAFSGLYLDGGVLRSLMEQDAFDTATFLRFFVGDPLPLIREQLETMNVSIVATPFAALYGLAEMVKNMDGSAQNSL